VLPLAAAAARVADATATSAAGGARTIVRHARRPETAWSIASALAAAMAGALLALFV
jgi:hypothetical protein